MADAAERTEKISLELTDEDNGEQLWSADLVWKGGDQVRAATAAPIDLDDPGQTLIAVENERWQPQFKLLQQESEKAPDQLTGASGLDVAKFAWDIIKSSKPVTQADGAFTSVLASADKHWDQYGGAKEFKSPRFDWHGKNLLGMTLFRARYILKGTYKASYAGKRGDVPKGEYLPLVFFEIPEAFAAITWSLTGSGNCSAPSNMGKGQVVPMIYVSAKITASGWFQSFTKTFTYKVRGDTGYVGKA